MKEEEIRTEVRSKANQRAPGRPRDAGARSLDRDLTWTRRSS